MQNLQVKSVRCLVQQEHVQARSRIADNLFYADDLMQALLLNAARAFDKRVVQTRNGA